MLFDCSLNVSHGSCSNRYLRYLDFFFFLQSSQRVLWVSGGHFCTSIQLTILMFWFGFPSSRLWDMVLSTGCLSGRGSTSRSIQPKKEATEGVLPPMELHPAGTLWETDQLSQWSNKGAGVFIHQFAASVGWELLPGTHSLAIPVYHEASHQTESSRCCLSSLWLQRWQERHWQCQLHPCKSFDF